MQPIRLTHTHTHTLLPSFPPLQDAILSIGSAMTAVDFRDTVLSGIHLAFLGVKKSLVLLLDIESNVLAYFETNSSFKTLPKDGVVW